MEINGFKVLKENIHNLKVGEKYSTCPVCSHTRKKKRHKCLVVDWKKGLAVCYHPGCDSGGKPMQLHEYEGKKRVEEQSYKVPNVKLLRPLSQEHRGWLYGRNLTDSVIDAEKIQTSFEFITFPYVDDIGIVNWKQRTTSEKSYRQAGGARQTMYRLGAIRKSIVEQKKAEKPIKIIICEGELDALSWVVANCQYATSVSQGAPGVNDKRVESKLACVYNDLDVLKQADMVYLSVDNDEPGERLKHELTKLLQSHCTIMIIDHGEFKDANEVLTAKGKKELHKIFNEATEAPKIQLQLPNKDEEPIKFPVEVFPEFVQELFEHLERVKSYENSFMGISLMSVIGTVAGSRQIFDSGQYYNRCLLMSAMVARPSVNKSAPLRDFLKPIEQVNSVLRAEFNKNMEDWEINEELPKNAPTKELNIKKPRQKQLIFENATVEAVHGLHSENEDGLLCKADELRTWFDSLGQYKKSGKGSDVGFYLANFNGDSYTINRVEKSLHIELLHINIVGGIQPDKLTSFPTDNGFLQRFIFALPEKEPQLKSREKIDKALMSTYNDYITSAYYYFSEKEGETYYELTQEAYVLFYDYLDELRRQEIDENISSVLSQFLGKLTITFHRLCLILRIMDHIFDVLTIDYSLQIGVEHVENAIKLTKYFIETTKRVVSDKDTTRELQRVVYGKGESNKELILRMYKIGTKPADIAVFNGLSRSYVYKIIKDNEHIKK